MTATSGDVYSVQSTRNGSSPSFAEAWRRDDWIKGSDLETDAVVCWRCVDRRARITRLFSVGLHKRSVGKLLRKLGLMRLQLRPYHPKKDAQARESFKKNFAGLVIEALLTSAIGRRWRCGSRAGPRAVMSVFKGCGRKIPRGLLSRLRSVMQACAVEGGH